MDSQALIKALYDAGYNHTDIALRLYKEKKLYGLTTTEKECLEDVEHILLELHRRR